jgi:hypothetical protein
MSEKTKYLEALKQDFNALKTVPKEYLADKAIVKAAFDRPWYEYIQFFNGYPDIFLGLKNFELVDATLRYNKDFVKELIPLCSGYLFSHLPKALREDKDLFLFALSFVGADYVFSKLKSNCQEEGERWDEMGIIDIEYNLRCEIEKKSITENAGENLLKDKEVVYKILEIEPDSFCYIDDIFYSDKDIALIAVSKGCYNYSCLNDELKQDNKIIKVALEGNGIEPLFDDAAHWSNIENYVIRYIPSEVMNDKSFCLEIINDTQKRFRAPEFFFQFISDGLKDDKNFVLELAKIKPSILKYIGEDLKNDAEILRLKILNKISVINNFK